MSELDREPMPPVEESAQPSPPPTSPSSEPPLVRGSGSSGRKFFWGILGGCLSVFILLTIVTAVIGVVGNRDHDLWSVGAKVAIIPIEGEIFDARDTIDRLHTYSDNTSVRALVIRINSPGGAIVPSQEIFQEIRRVRSESGKPIIASMDSVAASGGYYIAAACDRIVANPGTITGSIGVILQWMNLEELLQWAKLKPETMTTGPMKDAGSSFREMSPEEKAYFQRIIEQLHQQFVRAIVDGRKGKLTEAEVNRLADGRIFTGEEALRLKLIDDLGNLDDAIKIAAKLGGVKGTPRTIWPRPERPGLLELLGKLQAAEQAIERVVIASRAPFAYRWSR